MLILLSIFGLFNLYTFGLMGWDKYQAGRGGWRVAERRLKQLSLFGGSAGIVAAMQTFRHKTRKSSFYLPIYGSIFLHILLLIGYFVAVR
jgi:uncharacterized membrane protein YsdA (DUF1294 family)